MKEKKLQQMVEAELMRCGHLVSTQPSVRVGGHTYNGDLKVSGTDAILEIKTENGDWRKGIGQCMSYRAAGYPAALVVESASRPLRETAEYARLLIVRADRFLDEVRLENINSDKQMEEVMPRVQHPEMYDSIEDKELEEYNRFSPNLNLSDVL